MSFTNSFPSSLIVRNTLGKTSVTVRRPYRHTYMVQLQAIHLQHVANFEPGVYGIGCNLVRSLNPNPSTAKENNQLSYCDNILATIHISLEPEQTFYPPRTWFKVTDDSEELTLNIYNLDTFEPVTRGTMMVTAWICVSDSPGF